MGFSSLQGLSLFQHETKLFPKELVLPSQGIGLNKDGTSPKHIIQYQLNVETCPHLSSTNKCRIYEKRPLMCRSFPLKSSDEWGLTATIRVNCRSFKEIQEQIDEPLNFLFTESNFQAPREWKALQKRMELIDQMWTEHLLDTRFFWAFDLRSKQWVIAPVSQLR